MTPSVYATRPWLKHYDYWVRPAPDLPGPAAVRNSVHDRGRDAGGDGDGVSRRDAVVRARSGQRTDRLAAALLALGDREGRPRRHHAAELSAVHHRRVRHAATRRQSSSTSTPSTHRVKLLGVATRFGHQDPRSRSTSSHRWLSASARGPRIETRRRDVAGRVLRCSERRRRVWLTRSRSAR